MARYDPTIVETFRELFQVVEASTKELKDVVYRIRYDVYCEELGFENKEDFPDGRERDQCDARSLHYLIRYRPTEQFVGCIRLILANLTEPAERFPFEDASRGRMHKDKINVEEIDRRKIGEVSRLAVVSSFRKREGEQSRPEQVVAEPGRRAGDERRRYPHVALGLYLAGAAAMFSQGLRGVFAMMEPKLARGVAAYGLKFRQVSEVVDYHGMRAAFYITREEVYAGLPPEGHALLRVIEEDLGITERKGCKKLQHSA